MSNLCSNNLIILAPEVGMIEFLIACASESKKQLSKNGGGFRPFPDEDGSSPILDFEITEGGKGNALYSFLSNQIVAIDFAERLAQSFPKSEFKIDYIESGCSHAGQIHYHDGKLSFRYANGLFWDTFFHGNIQDVPLPSGMLAELPYRVTSIAI
jgi:hypothetical protein